MMLASLMVGGLLAWSWPWSGAPGVEVAKISVPKDCDPAALVKVQKSMDKSERDVLFWRIHNACPKPVMVALTSTSDRFKCLGMPATANLGTPFRMNARDTVFIVCTVAYPEADEFTPVKYPFDFGFRVEDPAQPPGQVMGATEAVPQTQAMITVVSEIAIEVEP